YPRGRAILLDLKEAGRKRILEHAGVAGCVLSPDGRWAVTWRPPPIKERSLEVWDTADGKPVPWRPPAGEPFRCFTSDGRWLVTGQPGDSSLHYWQVGSWQPGPTRFKNHLRTFSGVLPSPDDALLVWLDTVRPPWLVHAGTGKALAALESPRDAHALGG